MTISTGKLAGLVLLLGLLLGGAASHAAVDAVVDRQQLALGDTLRLTISATEDGEEVSGVDLSLLEVDFEVLQRSTQSNTRIVNGERSHTRLLIVEIAPRRTGNLTIPAFRVGSALTRPITVAVSAAPQVDPGDETVLFEAELDRDEVYVQGQLILTLRLQQAVNLERRSVTELELDNAFVLPLEQQTFQRTINGRPWLVYEIRYAIFPEQSGTLEIPAQRFSARETRPRRSLFDTASGPLLRRSTAPLRVEVLPRPAEYPAGATWLPARDLILEETWSRDPATLRAGESITRTIEIRGAGLQGAQLPPVTHRDTEGLKFFPDQPDISDAEISTGVLGSRRDSVAIVPTRAGQVTLPELRIPWWDTEQGALRFAVLPALTLEVAPAAAAVPEPSAVAGPAQAAVAARDTAPASALVWQVIALVCALGWAVTLWLLWRGRRRGRVSEDSGSESHGVRNAYKRLLAACATDQATQARSALITWGAAAAGDKGLTSLAAVAALYRDPELDREIELLERSLFAATDAAWRGAGLAEAVKRLHRQRPGARKADAGARLALYPGG